MGGSSSKTSTDIYTSNIVEAMSKTIQNCSGNTVISQQVVIKGNYNVVKNVRLVQGMKLSTSCSLDDKNIAAAQQAVENAIKQQSEAQNVALLGALSSSSSRDDTKIRNEVRATITRETIQNIVNNFNATQEFYLDGNNSIVEDISMEQSMQVLFDNCLSALSQMSTVQDVMNNAELISKATQTNPISEIIGAIGNIITSLGGMWTIVIIVAMVVGGYIIIQGGFLGTLFGDDDSPNSQIAAMQAKARQMPIGPPMYMGPSMPQSQMPQSQMYMGPSMPQTQMYMGPQMPMFGLQPAPVHTF